MKEAILSIDQMKRLQSVGVDTSTAKYLWDYKYDNELDVVKYPERMKKYIEDGNGIGGFTLENILDLLPPYFKKKDEILRFEIEKGSKEWTCKYLYVQWFVRETMIEAAYEMLYWFYKNKISKIEPI